VGTARSPVTLFIADPALVPVEFVSFSASVVEGKVSLSWITASERNNYGFEVERSFLSGGEMGWEKIGFVSGMGTTTEFSYYLFDDSPERNGKFRYRVKQVDFDGSVSYSKFVEVDVVNEMKFELGNNYPNPFNPETRFSFSLPVGGDVVVELFNSLGELVKVPVKGFYEAGNHNVVVSGADLPSGVYLYRLSSGVFMGVRKMVLVK
jgi:hypothetical protein